MIVNDGTKHQKSSNTNYEVHEGGAVIGRCIRIIDTGTHIMPFRDKETGDEVTKREMRITFELADTMQDGRPFIVTWTGTPSLNEKSALHKMLVAWRGKPFTPDEMRGFDLNNILDKCCLVNVTKTPNKQGDKFYNNVQSVMQLPKGFQAPERVNDLLTFEMNELGNEEKLNKLWPQEKKKVMNSIEGLAYFSGEKQEEEPQENVNPLEIPF